MFLEKSAVRFQYRLLLTFGLILLASSHIFAQGSGSIMGLVKDQNEAVVAGAVISATNKGSGKETTTTTDTNGKYDFAKPYSFSSPSAAAAVVLDRNSNGRTEWKVKGEKRNYQDVKQAQIATEGQARE